MALGDFDFSQYQLHKIILTITMAESARKDAAQDKRAFPGFQRLL